MGHLQVTRRFFSLLLTILTGLAPAPLLVVSTPVPIHASTATTAQWELRTTGNDNNGGCFVSGLGGTDFSQQNAAQYTFADLASANGTNAAPQVTSASHNFVAADVGNCMHISAGTNWTTGWYECVSAAANACTMDRAVGSVAALSAGTFFVGGGIATVNGMVTAVNSATTGGSGFLGGTVIGQVNVQLGTYTITASPSLNASGEWQGYQTTHGDRSGCTPSAPCPNANSPTITTATNSTPLIQMGGGGANLSVVFDNFIFTNTAVTPSTGLTSVSQNADYVGVRDSSFSGFTNAISSNIFLALELTGVEVKNSTGAGVVGANSGTILCNGCWIHNNTGDGIQNLGSTASGTGITVIMSLITNNGGRGINSRGGFFMGYQSTIAQNTGDGLSFTSGQGPVNAINCIFYGNGGFGVNAPLTAGNSSGSGAASPFNISRNNAYGANTSGARNNFNAGLNEITLTANPFMSATNFALNNTAGGGAALKNVGYPGTFPAGSTTGTLSIGAVQPASTGGCTAACRIR